MHTARPVTKVAESRGIIKNNWQLKIISEHASFYHKEDFYKGMPV
jgi:hypothetical protein